MQEKTQEARQIKSNKSGLGAVLSTSIYTVTTIMIIAFLYQTFSVHFFGE